jgi:3-oxoacyl-(acyl-carrier-protein) synthase
MIDAVLLHAPGTLKGDNAEINAVTEIFRDNLPALFSNKWQVGHSLGASAALNLVLALQILNTKKFPAFPYKVHVPEIKPKQFKSLLINAAGFGGNGGSLLVSSPEAFMISM